MDISGKNVIFNTTDPSKTEHAACQRLIVRQWKLLVVHISALFLVSWLSVEHAQRYRSPGFDFNLSRASTENLFVYHRSQHDVKKLLEPPELRLTDGGWITALTRFYSENVIWMKKVVELHPSQAHPVFLSAYFAPTLLTTNEKGSYWYNITQTFLFAVSLVLIWNTPQSIFFRSARYLSLGAIISLFFILFLLLHPLLGHAFSANVMWGQTNIPVLAMSTFGLFAVSRGWFGVGGACIGLAAGDKIFPLFLIATVPLRYWLRFICGAAIGTGAVLFLLVSKCGIVALADFLRWPFIAWHSNYNIISGGDGFWKYPPVNHSISHGISAISVNLSVGTYCELVLLSVLGILTLVATINTLALPYRSHTLSSLKLVNLLSPRTELKWLLFPLLLGFVFPAHRKETLYVVLLYMIVDILRKLLTIKDCSYRVLCIAGVLFLVVFPATFKLIYDHHLIFLIAGGWSLLVAIGGSVQSVSIRLVPLSLLVVSVCLCNLPYYTLPFGSALAQFQLSCPIIGIFLAVIGLYFWSRTEDFREFASLS